MPLTMKTNLTLIFIKDKHKKTRIYLKIMYNSKKLSRLM